MLDTGFVCEKVQPYLEPSGGDGDLFALRAHVQAAEGPVPEFLPKRVRHETDDRPSDAPFRHHPVDLGGEADKGVVGERVAEEEHEPGHEERLHYCRQWSTEGLM